MNETQRSDAQQVLDQVNDLLVWIDEVVIHVETGTVGNVRGVYPKGCWRDADGNYFDPDQPRSEDEKLMHITAPTCVLSTGDAFVIRSGSFTRMPRAAAALHAALRDTLKLLLTGFTVSARVEGLAADGAVLVAKSVLRAQLRAIEAPVTTSMPKR